MDTAPLIPPTPPITSNNNPKLLILGLFSIFLLGVGIGFYVIFSLISTRVKDSSPVLTHSNNTSNMDLPPQIIEYLENPVLTNWAIRIVGKIVDKSDNTLTIEKDGDQIKMVVDSKTEFKTFSSTPSSTKPISFQDVKVGDSIQGSANVEYTNRQVKITGLVLGIQQ